MAARKKKEEPETSGWPVECRTPEEKIAHIRKKIQEYETLATGHTHNQIAKMHEQIESIKRGRNKKV